MSLRSCNTKSSEPLPDDVHLRTSVEWGYVFLFVSMFSLVALWSIPDQIRPTFLTLGSFLALTFSGIVLWRQCIKDPSLLVFAIALLVYWLLAFPAAINGNDDNTAYLIFATDFYDSLDETIQPLSERRLFSVGGLYAFQAPIMHWFGPYGLSLVEPVFGLLLFFVVITATRSTSNPVGCFLLVGLVSLGPMAGSKVLGNTSSVFVLSAFSFALIEIGKEIVKTRCASWLQVALLAILPLAAATYRPTTAPFNVVIAFMLAVMLFSQGSWRKLLIAASLATITFVLALMPYHEIGGTYLYPILGKGTHISSEGLSIAGSISPLSHLQAFVRSTLLDPLFLIVSVLILVLSIRREQGYDRRLYLALYVSYAGFYALIVTTTGGVSSVRYIFPVSFAIVFSLLLATLETFGRASFSLGFRFPILLKSAWVVSIAAVFIAVRLTVGPAVIDKRQKMYEVSEEMQRNIADIQSLIEESEGAVLLIHTGVERFIVDGINTKYFIMDQPGMLSPWSDKGLSYKQGLIAFIADHDIKKIVLRTPNCRYEKGKESPVVGWRGIATLASKRNRNAICSIISDFDQKILGPFVVANRRQL